MRKQSNRMHRKILTIAVTAALMFVLSSIAAFADTSSPQLEKGEADAYVFTYKTQDVNNAGVLMNVFVYEATLESFDEEKDRRADKLLNADMLTADSEGNFSGTLSVDTGKSAVVVLTASRPGQGDGSIEGYVPADDIFPQDGNLIAGGTAYLMPVQILETPTIALAAGSAKYNSIKVSWSQVTGASGYDIYQAAGTKGAFKLIKTVNSSAAGSYTAKGLLTGTKYRYKVCAFVSPQGQKMTSKFSAIKSLTPYLPATSIKSITAGKKKLTLKWAKVSGANGYVIYRAVKKSGTYKAVKTITKGSTVTFANKGLKAKKLYYYKIRAYRTVNGKKVFAAYSAIKSKKTK